MGIVGDILLDSQSRKAFVSIKNLANHSESAIRKGWYFVGKELQREARQSIIKGPKTGRFYNVKGRKRRHRASAPFEAPATLSGDLQKSVDFLVHGWQRMSFGAGSDEIDYAKYLEDGTTKMTERPYLLRAILNKEKQTRVIMARELKKGLT